MHMADAVLSPAVGATFWAGTLAAIGFASKKLKENIDDKMIPLMGVLGAFIFAAQMVNFTIPGTGSSGHIGGGMILSVIVGPHAAFLALASVLSVQALFFADGGLLALGCNIWNLGVYPCFVAYPLIYRPLVGAGNNRRRVLGASVLSVVVALQAGAFSVVLETLLSGKSELPLGTFALFMQPIHLVIGIVEGIVTAGVISYVRTARPELLGNLSPSRPFDALPMKNVLVGFLALAFITAGALSWFASTHPDGLEWSIARITGKTGLVGQEQGIATAVKEIQEKTAVLPGYNVRPVGHEPKQDGSAESWPNMKAGTSLSGIIGAGLVLGFILLIGAGIRAFRHRH